MYLLRQKSRASVVICPGLLKRFDFSILMDEFLDTKKQEARLRQLIKDFSVPDKKLINQALKLAKEKHAGQERKEGGPYVIHPIRVACCLIEEVGIREPEAICAALLHDTIEDTDLSLKELTQKFGERIKKIVLVLTRAKAKDETEQNRYERKYQHFLKIMKADEKVKIVKACDWLDNMRSWLFISQNSPSVKKLPRWFKEAETMYLPLAKSVNSRIAEKMKEILSKVKFK